MSLAGKNARLGALSTVIVYAKKKNLSGIPLHLLLDLLLPPPPPTSSSTNIRQVSAFYLEALS